MSIRARYRCESGWAAIPCPNTATALAPRAEEQRPPRLEGAPRLDASRRGLYAGAFAPGSVRSTVAGRGRLTPLPTPSRARSWIGTGSYPSRNRGVSEATGNSTVLFEGLRSLLRALPA